MLRYPCACSIRREEEITTLRVARNAQVLLARARQRQLRGRAQLHGYQNSLCSSGER